MTTVKGKTVANVDELAPPTWSDLPPPKQHALLSRISNSLKGCHYRKTVKILGASYEMSTIDPSETTWTTRFIQTQDLYQFGQARRAPTVAAALRAIGPETPTAEDPMVPVEALFELDEKTDESIRALLENNPAAMRDWKRLQLLRWLTAPEQHEELIRELYDVYLELNAQRLEALEAIGPLSKRTPIGASEPSSSPEKESSPQTPSASG